MHKAELLKQLSDVLENGTDVKKVKITYKNGEAMKIAFNEIEDEDEDKDKDKDKDEDKDEDKDNDNDNDNDNDKDKDKDDDVIAEKVVKIDVIQESGWKVSMR